MMRNLILKELRYNILNFRFMVVLVFVVLAFAASSMLFCKKFQNELEEYQKSQQLYENALEAGRRGLSELFRQHIPLTKSPSLSSLFASGREDRFPKSIRTSAQLPATGPFAGMRLDVQKNYKLGKYTDFDWVFLIGVVMSFLAVILSFDAVSREREEGTLKLQLSNSVPRLRILLSKYVAIVVVLGVSSVPGFVVGNIIVLTLLGHDLLTAFPLELALMGILTILYLSVFIWGALAISCVASRSSMSLAVLLLFWIFFVILTPYLGGMIAEKLYPVVSADVHAKQREALTKELFDAAPEEYYDVYRGKETEEGWKVIEAFFEQKENSSKQFMFRRFNDLLNQANRAEWINAMVTPFGSFRYAAERIAGTGLQYHERFFHAVSRYREELRNFIRMQDLQDPDSKHRLYYVGRMQSISLKPVVPEIIPRFKNPDRNVLDFQGAFPAIGSLLLFNLICFCVAAVCFSRMDVR